MTVLLGGETNPLALNVQYVQAPESDVIAAYWSDPGPGGGGPRRSVVTGLPLPSALDALLPFEAPWTRMLTAQIGDWTAIVNNSVLGGDSSSPFGYFVSRLKVRAVSAAHFPPYRGHGQTSLEVLDPKGKWDIDDTRSIAVTAEDGRWIWHQSGTPFPFEQAERYSSRLKRNRFDRELLLAYLEGLGIPVADAEFGVATLHQVPASYERREMTLEETRQAMYGELQQDDVAPPSTRFTRG